MSLTKIIEPAIAGIVSYGTSAATDNTDALVVAGGVSLAYAVTSAIALHIGANVLGYENSRQAQENAAFEAKYNPGKFWSILALTTALNITAAVKADDVLDNWILYEPDATVLQMEAPA